MNEEETLRKLEYSEYMLDNRIKLRRLKKSDTEDMYEYTRNKDSCTFLKWGPHTHKQQAYEFILKRLKQEETISDLLWGIELIEENKLIGVVRIYHIDFNKRQAEISYIISPLYSGKGYATLSVKYIISLCFDELELEQVVAFFVDKNEKSKKLLNRCGAVVDKEWKEAVEIKNRIYQLHRCYIKKDISPKE